MKFTESACIMRFQLFRFHQSVVVMVWYSFMCNMVQMRKRRERVLFRQYIWQPAIERAFFGGLGREVERDELAAAPLPYILTNNQFIYTCLLFCHVCCRCSVGRRQQYFETEWFIRCVYCIAFVSRTYDKGGGIASWVQNCTYIIL